MQVYDFLQFNEEKGKKLKKKLRNYPKMLIFGKIFMKFAGCHGNVKNYKHKILAEILAP